MERHSRDRKRGTRRSRTASRERYRDARRLKRRRIDSESRLDNLERMLQRLIRSKQPNREGSVSERSVMRDERSVIRDGRTPSPLPLGNRPRRDPSQLQRSLGTPVRASPPTQRMSDATGAVSTRAEQEALATPAWALPASQHTSNAAGSVSTRAEQDALGIQARLSPAAQRAPNAAGAVAARAAQIAPEVVDATTPGPSTVGPMVWSSKQGYVNRLLSGWESIPGFSGNIEKDNMSAQVWIKRLESLAKIFCWDERFLIHQMTSKLSGNARLWFDSLQEIDLSWLEWKTELVNSFPEGRGIASKLYDFVTVQRANNESVLDFYYKKLSLGKQCDQPDHVVADVIIYTLNNPLLKAGARGPVCRDTRSLLQYLTDAAGDNIAYQNKVTDVPIVNKARVARMTKQRDDVTCYKCGVKGHFASQCTKTDTPRCERCLKFGHVMSNCKENKQCSNCNRWGHNEEHC